MCETRSSRLSGGRLVADHAVQHLAQPRAATLLREHPRPQLPRRIVPHVLVMAAGQFRDPVVLIVLMKACYRLLHGSPRGDLADSIWSLDSIRSLAARSVTDDIPERDHAERNTEHPGSKVTHINTSVFVSARSRPHSPLPI
jgi:hypothetical protein